MSIKVDTICYQMKFYPHPTRMRFSVRCGQEKRIYSILSIIPIRYEGLAKKQYFFNFRLRYSHGRKTLDACVPIEVR